MHSVWKCAIIHTVSFFKLVSGIALSTSARKPTLLMPWSLVTKVPPFVRVESSTIDLHYAIDLEQHAMPCLTILKQFGTRALSGGKLVLSTAIARDTFVCCPSLDAFTNVRTANQYYGKLFEAFGKFSTLALYIHVHGLTGVSISPTVDFVLTTSAILATSDVLIQVKVARNIIPSLN